MSDAGFYHENGTQFSCRAPAELRCVGNNTCGEVYEHPPECLGCLPGYWRNRNVCSECPELFPFYVLGVIVCMFLLSNLLMKFARSGTHYMTSIGVAFNFFQVIGLLSTFSIGWEDQILTLLYSATVFNFDQGLFPVDCFRSKDSVPYATKWGLKLAVPFFFLFVFIVTAVCHQLYYVILRRKAVNKSRKAQENLGESAVAQRSKREEQLERGRRKVWAVMLNGYLAFLLLVYVSITLAALETYDCEDPDEKGLSIHRLTYETCYKSPKEHSQLIWIGWIALIGYGICIPFVLAIALFHARNSLHMEQNVLKYGLVYRKYRTHAFLWEIFITLRKMAMVITKTAAVNERWKIGMIALICLISTVVQVLVWPYQSRRVNRMETLSLVVLVIIGIVAMLFFPTRGQADAVIKDSEITGGFFIIGCILFVTVALVMLILYDFLNARRAKSAGLRGAFASEDVQISPHFFASKLRNVTDGKWVSTSDHYTGLKIQYEDPASCGFKVAMDVSLEQDQGAFAANRSGVGELTSMFVPDSLTRGDISVQNDEKNRIFVINALIPEKGNYVIRFSGGKPKTVSSRLCFGEKRMLKPRDAGRLLMEYRLVVSHPTVANVQFVDMTVARGYNITIYTPVVRFLSESHTYCFRVHAPRALGVRVDLVGLDLRLPPEGNAFFVGNIHINRLGDVHVLVDYPSSVMLPALPGEAAPETSRTEGQAKLQTRTILSYVAVAEDVEFGAIAEREAPDLPDALNSFSSLDDEAMRRPPDRPADELGVDMVHVAV